MSFVVLSSENVILLLRSLEEIKIIIHLFQNLNIHVLVMPSFKFVILVLSFAGHP